MSEPDRAQHAALVTKILERWHLLEHHHLAALLAGLSLADLRVVAAALATLCAAVQAPDCADPNAPTQ